MDLHRNLILEGTAKRHFWRGRGGFSLKSFTGGCAQYRIGPHTRRVDPRHYLLVNAEVEYEIEIDQRTPVTAFCLFFSEALLADAYAVHRQSMEQRLDQGALLEPVPFCVVEELQDRRDGVGQALQRMREAVLGEHLSEPEQEEWFHRLVERIVEAGVGAERRIQQLPPVRSSTRFEVYRRVAVAKDYMLSLWDQSLTLAQISRAAALSPNHLLRAFRWVHGVSPWQFLQGVRLREAARKLGDSHATVTEVAMACGFESVPTFSRTFRQRYGVSPRQFRKKVRLDKTGDA